MHLATVHAGSFLAASLATNEKAANMDGCQVHIPVIAVASWR